MKFKNLTYITYQVFPNEKANTLQTIRMLESLSNCGLNVKLVFPNREKRFKGESKIETWMFRIAYNESMRFLKQKKQHYRLDDVDSSYLETLKADPYFDGEESEYALHNALSSLKGNERHIFNLKYFDGLKFSQVAQLTNTNENSVKTLYYKAEKKIKQQLEKWS